MVHELHIWHSDCSAKCADAVNYTIWWYMVYGIIMLRIEIKADEEMKILPPHYYCKHVALCTTRLRLTSELMASTVQHSKAPVAQLGSMLANSPVTAVGLAFIASSYILSHSNRPSTSVREGKTRSKGRQLVDFFQRNESLLFFLAAFLLHNTILHFRLNAGLDGISSTLVDDLSWQYSLPVSLVASIISSKTSTDLLGLTQLVPMFIAFIMGSLGSVLGGLTFGCIIRCFTSSQQAVNAGVASSLIASYIGGTVNFYETASVLMHSLPKHLFQKSIRITSAIDVLVMIVYFAFLQRKHKSLLGKGVESGAHTDRHDKQLVDVARHSENNLPIWQLPVLLFCIAIVKASQLLTAKFIPLVGQVPGLSTMLLCALSSAAALLFNNNLTTSIHSNIIQSGQVLASLFLNLFYTGLGATLHWKDLRALTLPSLAIFPVMLFVHVRTLDVLTKIANRFLKPQHRIDEDTKLIASNACVGGAATAASMASSFSRADLIVPATIAGIFGYIIGTPVGVACFHMLMKFK